MSEKPTRRSLRAAADDPAPVGDESAFPGTLEDLFDAPETVTKPRRPLLKSFRFWVPISLLVLLVGGTGATVYYGSQLADQAFAARDSLQAAIPLASTVKDQVLAGDTEQAQATAEELKALTAEAREHADGRAWRLAESVPFIGPNLAAVRTVAVVVDDLVVDALQPATALSIDSFKPVDGRIDVDALETASDLVDEVAIAVGNARQALDGIDTEELVDQVSSGVRQLDGALTQIEPLIEPAQKALAVLPGILGADEPRRYLVLVQNNAESRGTGGNPAALLVVGIDNGEISIQEQASSSDFNNGRRQPIIELDPQTAALYGDKVGRYMQDVTLTPDFTESAAIMGAFWEESFGTPIDGTVSIDPVALSYFMQATPPVTLPRDGVLITGDEVLTADNVVSTLLNEVYFRYSDPRMQDAYFALAAGAVFDTLTSADDPRALVEQVIRAVDEGRLLYAPKSEAEAEAIAGTRFTGTLPTDNSEITMVGSYINDITEGKLNYYMNTAVDVVANCQAEPSFEVTTTVESILQPGEVRGLASYISPGRFFPKGVISTDVVLYGPVGARFVSAAVDGSTVSPRAFEHLGRPAVKINVQNQPATTRTVTAVFEAGAGEYGPVEAWYTPMVRETPVTVSAAGCGG